jgi:glycosyltransferase involved in cell wall biosynthesis
MLSIITPVCNGKQFIEDCIQNVINQNSVNIEHIIVDGGSSDGTMEIVELYAAQHRHIRWISERDRGQSDAMNKGVALAQGEIIGFLNVDDYYEDNILDRISEIFANLTQPSFVVGNCNVLNESGDVVLVNKPKKMKLKDLVVIPRLNPAPCNPSAYFYHKSIHAIVGLYSLEEHYAMDLDFILRVVRVANSVYFDEVWGNFRLHKATKTAQDIDAGNMNARMYELFKKYRLHLSFLEKFQVGILDIFSTVRNSLSSLKSIIIHSR